MGKKINLGIGLALCLVLLLALVLTAGCYNANSTNTTNSSNQTKKYPPIYGFAVKYCEKLGYIYEYRMNDSNGMMEEYCRLSKEIECKAGAFAGGECHHEFTLCEREGYISRIGVEKKGNTTIRYPICVFPDGRYCKEKEFFEHNCLVDWEE